VKKEEDLGSKEKREIASRKKKKGEGDLIPAITEVP